MSIHVVQDEKVFESLWDLLLSGGFAAIGGALHYWLKIIEGHAFRWAELVLAVLTSSFCGLICFEVLIYEGFPAELSSALCGLSGWMGSRILKIVEVYITKKIKVSEND